MKTKLKIIIPAATALIAIIIAAFAIRFDESGSNADISAMISTAQKYLVGNNYEQAVMEYEAVINLEPNNAEAYLGITEAYVGMGDTGKAIEWLEKGYALTGDERLKDMLDGRALDNTATKEVEYVNVAGYSIPNNINVLAIVGPDTEYFSYSMSTDEENFRYRLSEPLTDISFITKLKNLTNLDLSLNAISDLTPLSEMTGLTYLNLESNQISDISPLCKMTNLTYLYLDNNQISDISALSGMTGITSLFDA